MAVPADLKRVISSAVSRPFTVPPAERGQVALDPGKVELALVARLQQVARLGQRPVMRVDIDGGARHHLAIGLAHGGLEGAGEIDMGSGLQPLALDDGCGRGGHTADDVRLAHGVFEVASPMRLEAVRGRVRRPAPRPCAGVRL